MKKNVSIFLFFIFPVLLFSQHIKSEAFQKKGLFFKTPLLKPKYPSYNLAATYLLSEKARKGDPFAQHELGIRYILGIGVPVDSLKAAYWIKQAALKRLPAANFNYAVMLSNGIGVKWNPFEAFDNFEISAKSGMKQAQYIVGLTYIDNLVVSRNLNKAYYWLKKAADKDMKEAKDALSELVKNNKIIFNDSLQNNTAFNNSKTKNISSPQETIYDYEPELYNFGNDSLANSTDIRKYLKKIIRIKTTELKKILKINLENYKTLKDTTSIGIINIAANSGNPEALLLKGKFNQFGIGLKKNKIKAASYFLKAYSLGSFKAAEYLLKLSRSKNFYRLLKNEIAKNNANAMYVWSGLVALGMDYKLTEKQAFGLLLKAQKQNHINSIIELGLVYYNGTLRQKDTAKAFNYFEQAAKLGSAEAKVRLAFYKIKQNYNNKLGTEINILKKYANQGSILATAALAFCYDKGYAVKQNKATAVKLYRNAARHGNEAAYNSLRQMYDSLRPDDEKFKIFF